MGTFTETTSGDLNGPISIEQLGRAEAAVVSGFSSRPWAKWYGRALTRLKDVPATMPGGWESP
jgi:hypothetical protein